MLDSRQKIINELHTWILNECSQKSLVTTLHNEIWLRQDGITLVGVYQYCKGGNKLTFTASPFCWEIVLDNTKPQNLSHTDISLQTSVESSNLKATLTQLLSTLQLLWNVLLGWKYSLSGAFLMRVYHEIYHHLDTTDL